MKNFYQKCHLSYQKLLSYIFFDTYFGNFVFIIWYEFFDALAHSFTTISTGGFSTHDQSFAYFNSSSILLIAIIFMIIGSLPFLVIAQTVLIIFCNYKRSSGENIFINIICIYLYYLFFAETYINGNLFDKIISISFNTISVISGTGYVSENFENWGNYASVLFLILMFIGGCAGSTTGGLKVFRFSTFKYLRLHFKKMLQPHAVIAGYFNNKSIPESTYESVMSFFFLYILTFASSALLLSFSGLDFLTCVSAAASAISNVGPGLGDIIGPEGNYSLLSDYSKIVLTATMFLGRLEMLTIFILFLPSFWKN